MRRWILIVVCALTALAGGLGVADTLGLDWLRVVAVAIAPLGAGMAVMWFKRRDGARTRSDAADSIEAETDRSIRAASFLDALVIIAMAMLVGTCNPGAPAWLLPALVITALAVDYWVRFAFVANRRRTDADPE